MYKMYIRLFRLQDIPPLEALLKLICAILLLIPSIFYFLSILSFCVDEQELHDKEKIKTAIILLSGVCGLYSAWWLIIKFHIKRRLRHFPLDVWISFVLLCVPPFNIAYQVFIMNMRPEGIIIALFILFMPVGLSLFLLNYIWIKAQKKV